MPGSAARRYSDMSMAPPRIAEFRESAPRTRRRTWRRVLKWAALILGFALVLAVLAVAFKDPLIKAFAEHRIKSKTGMNTQIDELQVSLTTGRVLLKDLKIFNTAEFGGGLFLHVPEIYLEVEPNGSSGSH